VRWHVVESAPGRYDWSSFLPMLRAARETGTQVAWDLLHFGWPDHVDVFSADFPERFARFVRAFLQVAAAEGADVPFIAPVNEISFLSFAGGEEGFFFPYARKRGDDLKRQLVRAAIAASRIIRETAPSARIIHTDPIINIVADPTRPEDRAKAEGYRLSQFASWDMIAGRAEPELGGEEWMLDVLGVNYYIHNQWIHEGSVLVPSHPQHLPLRYMLREVSNRYRRPMFIAETGIEAEARPSWLHSIGREVQAARALGVPLEGICLYPIVDHPGWEDDRHCPNGLWGYPDDAGEREIDVPLAEELRRQQQILEAGRTEAPLDESERSVLDSAAHQMEEATERSRDIAAGGSRPADRG
jgi:beta-glucosidase/6-phospho-beta-glucosidase/beta-galactosidase